MTKSNKKQKTSDPDKEYKSNLRKKQAEIRLLKKEIEQNKKEIECLNDNLDNMYKIHMESAENAVDLLYDLEYLRYKSSFVDIDIKLNPGNEKALKSYGKIIKNFFLNELKCSYLYIDCRDINDPSRSMLRINTTQKPEIIQEFKTNQSKVYYADLQDIDLPERKIGKIIIGREAYKDSTKERKYDKKIHEELHITKRILENCISKIMHKALAVKDALTGLYTRKVLDERLSEEYSSLDIFSKLDPLEAEVLNSVIEADSQPHIIIRNNYFIKYKTKDEPFFVETIDKLLKSQIISRERRSYLGEPQNFYFFENSKVNYNLFVAMFDLDHFKDVNDNWGGHNTGDRVLKEFASILKRNIRTTDIPVRYGGEEFIIIFPRATSSYKIKQMLEKIRIECEENLIISYKGKKRNVTVSIGMTRISKYDTSPQQIVTRADAALYRAKRRRNRLIIFEQGEDGYENITDRISQ